jgi:hypothetical protein
MTWRGLLPILLLPLLAEAALAATEELKYDVVDTRMGFEIRRYPSYLVAETKVTGPWDKVGGDAFRVLHDYISGNNRPHGAPPPVPTTEKGDKPEKGEKIEMTAPVIQAPVPGEKDTYVFAFVMPAKYAPDTLPTPNDPRVTIRQVPPRFIAAHRFRGVWSDDSVKRNEKTMMDSIDLAGLKAIGTPMWARYNPPITPWFMRRNETMVELEAAGIK